MTAPYAGPRSNREIADDLFLSVETVKTHLRALFDLFASATCRRTASAPSSSAARSRSGVLG